RAIDRSIARQMVLECWYVVPSVCVVRAATVPGWTFGVAMTSLPRRPRVDDVDRRLIEALRVDGRLSVRALAAQVHISRANAYARLERLREDGVITGFTAQVAPEHLGLGTSAYVSVSIEQRSEEHTS